MALWLPVDLISLLAMAEILRFRANGEWDAMRTPSLRRFVPEPPPGRVYRDSNVL
jgi:hypothetical protein